MCDGVFGRCILCGFGLFDFDEIYFIDGNGPYCERCALDFLIPQIAQEYGDGK